MMQALDASDRDEVELHAQQLISDHAKTEYAQIARLALAKNFVENGEFDEAQTNLEAVIDSGAQEPFALLARTRLAAVQLQTGQWDAALETLAIDFPPEFTALVAELRGDVYVQQGENTMAIESYRAAQAASPGPADPQFLQHKLTDLGVSG